MALRHLACPNGCATERFEALNAPLFVDAAARYLTHDDTQATFVCGLCGAVAVDLHAAARAMESETVAMAQLLVCPACGTEMLPPEDEPLAALMECPMCGQRFTVEEGTPRLHGGAAFGDGEGDAF